MLIYKYESYHGTVWFQYNAVTGFHSSCIMLVIPGDDDD